MSVKHVDDRVIVNDSLEISHDVLMCGVGPMIKITDLDDNDTITIATKQEAEEVMKACESFLKCIGDWDYVMQDDP